MKEVFTRLVGWLSFDDTSSIYCMDEKGNVYCIDWETFMNESADTNLIHAIKRDWVEKLRSLANRIEELAEEREAVED